MVLRIGLSVAICLAIIACPFLIKSANEINDIVFYPEDLTQSGIDVSEQQEIIPEVQTEREEQTIQEPPNPKPEYAKYLLANANVNLRSGAGTGYKILATLEKGGIVSGRGQSGDWYETVYKNQKAYVHKKYVTPFFIQKTTPALENVIATGERLLGFPYVYGAARVVFENGTENKAFNSKKYDCSSLTQYCFYKGAGKVIGLTTRAQYYDGKRIGFDELKRGDLMLFTNSSRYYNTGIERIGHVAIYLGDGYILHTASDFARIEKLTAARKKNFIVGVRVTL